MRHSYAPIVVVLSALLAFACEDDPQPLPDAGVAADAAPQVDAAPPADAAPRADATVEDAAPADAVAADADLPDAPAPDAVAADADTPDALAADAGPDPDGTVADATPVPEDGAVPEDSGADAGLPGDAGTPEDAAVLADGGSISPDAGGACTIDGVYEVVLFGQAAYFWFNAAAGTYAAAQTAMETMTNPSLTGQFTYGNGVFTIRDNAANGGCPPTDVGTYNVTFNAQCTTFTLALVSDPCPAGRGQVLNGLSFSL